MTKMQRRHFEAIAEIISKLHMYPDMSRREIAEQFASRLSTSNGNFNAARFIDACMNNTRTP